MKIFDNINEIVLDDMVATIQKESKEGCSVRESIHFSVNREKYSKLGTMLFIGPSVQWQSMQEKSTLWYRTSGSRSFIGALW